MEDDSNVLVFKFLSFYISKNINYNVQVKLS